MVAIHTTDRISVAQLPPRAKLPTRKPLQVASVEPADWDVLLEQFPQRTIFHGMAWLRSIQLEHNLKLILLKAERGDRCVGVWPSLETRKGPFRVIGSPLRGWSTAYLGPLVAPGVPAAAVLRALHDNSPLSRSSYFECRVMESDPRIDLSPLGFEQTLEFETYEIDLEREEDLLWQNMRKECRNKIRHAEKSGVEIRLEHDASFVDDFWRFSREIFAKSNLTPPFTRQFIQRLWDELGAQGSLCVVSAMDGGERVGGLMLPMDHRTMYVWAGGSPARHISGINNLMHWRAIQHAQRLGLKVFDFISSKGAPGQFKSAFGPEARIVATHWSKTSSRIVGLIKRVYERHLWQRRHRQARRSAARCQESVGS